MIRVLKRKFILITMSLISIILIIVFGSISMIYYHNLTRETFHVMERGFDNELDIFYQRPKIEPRTQRKDESFGARIPIFSVTLTENAQMITSILTNVSISEQVLKDSISEVLIEENDRGKLQDLDLLFIKKYNSDGTIKIVFADQRYNLEATYTLIKNLSLVGIIALIIFGLLSIFLANMAVAPVAKAWKKERQFLGDVSHELKTPLTVILTNLAILLSNGEQDKNFQMKWLKNSQEEAIRMKELLDKMLFLAKSEQYEMESFSELFNLSELLVKNLLVMEPLAYERNLKIKTEIKSGISYYGNIGQIKELLTILLDNALKYSTNDSEITVSLKYKGNYIIFSVNNFGEIIDPEDLEKIFDRFYRTDGSRVRTTGGYGLGLSIAESIIKNHNGKIWAESSEDEGTTFFFTLPYNKQLFYKERIC